MAGQVWDFSQVQVWVKKGAEVKLNTFSQTRNVPRSRKGNRMISESENKLKSVFSEFSKKQGRNWKTYKPNVFKLQPVSILAIHILTLTQL